MNGWAEFWLLGLDLIPKLAKERKAKVGGISFVVVAPREMTTEELGYGLYTAMPVNIARTVYSVVGSDKLRLQIEASQPGEPQAITFLKRALSLDLRTPRSLALVKAAFREFGNGTYLHMSLLAKLRDWWRLNSLSKKDHDEVVAILAAEITASGTRNSAAVTKQRSQLLKEELVLRIKRQNERRELP